jgi:acyl carrier protein
MSDSLTIKVREVIAAHFGIDPDQLTDESRFRDDFSADWLDRLELIIAIEDQVPGVEIADAVADQIDTIGDLMRAIKSPDSNRGAGAMRRDLASHDDACLNKEPANRLG